MKVMNIALIIAVFSAAITFHADSFARTVNKSAAQQVESSEKIVESAKSAEATVTVEREKVEQAMIDTETLKTAATLAINKAREQLANGEISAVEAAKIIGEQDYRIEQANKLLAMATRRAVDTVEQAEVEESYASQLMSGARGLGARVLAPFKSGYGYSEEEKAIARAIIAQLNRQLEAIAQEYANKTKGAATEQARTQAMNEWDTIQKEFAKAIYEQQLITGDVMSANRKLFWGAVGLAGAAIGGALAQQYLGAELPVAPTSGSEKPALPSLSESAPKQPELPSVSESGSKTLELPAPMLISEKQELPKPTIPVIPPIKEASPFDQVDIASFDSRALDVLNQPEDTPAQKIVREALVDTASAAAEKVKERAELIKDQPIDPLLVDILALPEDTPAEKIVREALVDTASAAAEKVKERAELVKDQPIEPLQVDILALPEDTASEELVRKTAADVARVTGETLKKGEMAVGRKLEKSRHNPEPLTPAKAYETLKEKGGELAEGIRSAAQALGESTSQEYAETVGAPEVYEGAEAGESLSERYPAETEQEYRARREKAQRVWQNPAEAAVKAQKEFVNRPRRSAEEQAELASEVGGQIYEGLKSTGKAFFGSSQNREFGQDPLALEKEEDTMLKAKYDELKELAQQRGAKFVERIDESGLPQRVIVREPSELPFD